MQIAPRCLPGHYNHCDHTPVMVWPEDSFVQWGGHGLVINSRDTTKSYTTAFFEAFTKSPDAFFRGEGETVADAERMCWNRFVSATQCVKHEFERRGYRNGGGVCRNCKLFLGHVFEPLETCVVCGCPTNYTTDRYDRWYCERDMRRIPFKALFDWQQELLKCESELS